MILFVAIADATIMLTTISQVREGVISNSKMVSISTSHELSCYANRFFYRRSFIVSGARQF